jgi:hypothetical protein
MAHKDGRKRKLTPYNIFILMFVALGSMTYGYTASIIGTTLGNSFPQPSFSGLILLSQGQPTFIKYFSLDTAKNGTDLESTMNGLFQTGGVIGTLLLPTVADKWGRKWALAVVNSALKMFNSSVSILTNFQGCVAEYNLRGSLGW